MQCTLFGEKASPSGKGNRLPACRLTVCSIQRVYSALCRARECKVSTDVREGARTCVLRDASSHQSAVTGFVLLRNATPRVTRWPRRVDHQRDREPPRIIRRDRKIIETTASDDVERSLNYLVEAPRWRIHENRKKQSLTTQTRRLQFRCVVRLVQIPPMTDR